MNTAVIQNHKFPGVLDYFEQFPSETLGNVLGKGGSFPVQFFCKDPHLSLEGIGKYLVTNCHTRSSAVIVCHGKPTELMIPLGTGSRQSINKKTMELLSRVVDDPVNCDYDGIAATCGFTSEKQLESYDNLIGYFSEIRRLNLRHVAFRACNVGQDFDFLIQAQSLFGCDSVSAPVKRDFFAKLKPKIIGPAEMDKLIRKFPNAYVYGAPNARVYITYKMTGYASAEIGFKADSEQAIRQFMKAKFQFDEENQYKRGDTIALHGLWNDNIAPYFFFPQDPGYTKLLRTYTNPLTILPMITPKERTGLRGVIDRIKERRQSRKMHRYAEKAGK